MGPLAVSEFTAKHEPPSPNHLASTSDVPRGLEEDVETEQVFTEML